MNFLYFRLSIARRALAIIVFAFCACPGVALALRPVLVTPMLPDATQNLAYQANLLTGGVLAPTSVIVTGLPNGLRYIHSDSGSVKIRGAPTVSDNANIEIEATNVDGSSTFNLRLKVLATVPVAGASAIGVGDAHACAILAGGLQCWGNNYYGQLSGGSTTHRSLPVEVFARGSGVTAVSTGSNHNCAIVNAALFCCGSGANGLLRAGGYPIPSPFSSFAPPYDSLLMAANHHLPTKIFSACAGVTVIAAGDQHTCVVARGGVQCWDANYAGQIDEDVTGNVLRPTLVVLSKPLGDVKAGGSQTCISSTNGLQCLGQWRAGLKQLLPADVRITDFSVGNLNVSAIANSALCCWGANDFGQLGDGNTTTLMANAANAKSPTQIHAAGSDVESISSGATHSCLLIRRATKTTPSRALTCWGNNGEGQFGSGVSSASRLPTDVFGTEKNITAASVDGATKCIVADGGLQCWGTKLLVSKLDSVQRIDVGYDATPQQIIAPDSDVTFVATRSEGACAVVAGGLRC